MAISVNQSSGNTISVSVSDGTSTTFSTSSNEVSITSPSENRIDIKAQGPKGDKGDRGETGAQGIQGNQGPQGIQGETGPQGIQGETGPAGADGSDGQGVPAGGDQYQVLRKVSGTDYDTEWSFSDRVTIEVRFDEAVSKGDPLYITGYNNGQNRITVAKADAADSSKMPSIGLAKDDYSQNDNGQATTIGSLEDIDTQVANDFQEGDVVYVASGGGLTNVKPTGTNLIQNVGKVGRRQQNNGEIVVMAIGRSNDVPNIPDGQIWIGNGSGVATPTAFGIDLDSTPQLGGDLDVNGNKITSASNGDITIDPDGTGAIIMKSDDIQFDGGGTFGGTIRLYESDILGSNFVALQAPLSVASDATYILPAAPDSGKVLQTDGIGNLSWVDRLASSNANHEGTFALRSLSGGSDALLAFYDDAGDNYIVLRAPDVLTSDTTFVLPAADGSSGQVLKTDGSGNLSFADSFSKTRRVHNMNFVDDIGFAKHYIPFQGGFETSTLTSAFSAEEGYFIAPTDGRIVSLSVMCSSISDTGAFRITIETLAPNASISFPPTVQETREISVGEFDENHAFHFVFTDAKHFDAFDRVAIGITSLDGLGGSATDITGSNALFSVTTITEFDMSTLPSEGEYSTSP